jgi:hypothetical protein
MVQIFLIIALWFALADGGSAACLNGYPTVQSEYELSYGVFLGTVISAQDVPPLEKYFDQDGVMYMVRVDEVLRGRLAKRVRLFSENSSGRFPMRVRIKYLLFVYRDHGRTIVDNCGNSEIYSKTSPVLLAVRKLKAHKKWQ